MWSKDLNRQRACCVVPCSWARASARLGPIQMGNRAAPWVWRGSRKMNLSVPLRQSHANRQSVSSVTTVTGLRWETTG